jgi:hypothetical protein
MKNALSLNRLISLVAVFGILVILASNLQAYQTTTHKTTGTSTRDPVHSPPATHKTSETYAVVSVGDEIQVVPKSSINTLKKQLKDEYSQELKAYQQDKKGKNSSNLKKPVEKKFAVINSTFKTQEDAQKWADDKYGKKAARKDSR